MSLALTYRPFPGYLVAALLMEILMIFSTAWLLRDPDVLTAKGLFLLSIVSFGHSFFTSVAVRVWQTAWRFTVTETHLIVEHVYKHERHAVPWVAIDSVTKAPRSWWNRRGGLPFTQLVTADGRKFVFGMYLIGYWAFLEQLRSRATSCRSFDPYVHAWER